MRQNICTQGECDARLPEPPRQPCGLVLCLSHPHSITLNNSNSDWVVIGGVAVAGIFCRFYKYLYNILLAVSISTCTFCPFDFV